MLAKSVYVSFGNLDAKLSDNYFDLLPGEAVDLLITSAASLDDLNTDESDLADRRLRPPRGGCVGGKVIAGRSPRIHSSPGTEITGHRRRSEV